MRTRNLVFMLAQGLLVAMGGVAMGGHYYGFNPTDNDPPIGVIEGVLLGDGTLIGTLAASAPQPNEGFAHIVFFANVGDNVTIDTNGSDADSGLALLLDAAQDGIFVGDAPPNVGTELTFSALNDDGGTGLDSLINFSAPYTGAYLASIAEISGRTMNWVLNVNGSTFVPEPSALVLLGVGSILLGGASRHRRVRCRRESVSL